MLLASADVTLPSEYVPLEWIRSSGTQYIDTEVIPPEDAVIEMEMTVQKEQPQIWATVFGARALGASTATYEFDVSSGTGVGFGRYRWIRAGSASGQAFKDTAEFYGQRNRFRCSLRDLTWQAADGSGAVENLTVQATSGDCQCSLYIFAVNELGAIPANSYASIQLYSFRIIVGETCVRDFVPCRRLVDGEAGLYDCVNGVFYGNRGTGSLMGSDTSSAMLSWLHSSGSQYVNVAYTPLETDIVRAVFDVKPGGKTFASAFGAREPSDGCRHALELDVYGGTANTYRYWCGNGYVGGYAQFYNQTIEVVCSGGSFSWRPLGAENFAENGQVTSTGDCLRPLYVFALNDGGVAKQYATLKLHSLDIVAADSTPRQRLLPARDASGNLGLLDLVDNQFYPNLGTTTFDWSGIAYTMNGTTLIAYEGTLTSADLTGFTALEKSTQAHLEASAVTNLPPLTLGEGVFALANGEPQVYDVAGELTLRGGARLKLDLSRTGCDVLVAQTLNLEEASSENPFIIDLSPVEGAGLDGVYPIIRAAGLAADMAGRMKVVGVPNAVVKVENGEIVVSYADPTIPVTAVWTGAGVDPGNVADPANWSCTNGLGREISAVPTALTSVRLLEGCAFVCTNGAPFVCREFVLPETLSGDSDWRGVSAPLWGTMRLNGHKLQLSVLNGGATITDGDYQPLDYLESSGTQYINTQMIVAENAKIEAEMTVPRLQPNKWASAFGVRSHVGYTDNQSFELDVSSGKNGTYRLWRGVQAVGTQTEFYGQRILVSTQLRDLSWKPAGADAFTETIRCDQTSGNCIYPMFLFCLDENGVPLQYSSVRIHSFKIIMDGVVVCDLVPVKRLSDGALGMLDRANGNAFRENAGTGTFIAGAALPVSNAGELWIDVPEGVTVQNDAVSISGATRLVKEGAGTFVAAKQYQTYFGGTEVVAGKLTTPAGTGTSIGFSANENFLGVSGSEIVVRADATFDVAGNYDYYLYHIILDGGTLLSGSATNDPVPQTQITWGGVGWLTLSADSTFYLCNDLVFNGGNNPIDLGGHTLTINAPIDSKFIPWSKDITNGVIHLLGVSTAKEYFRICNNAVNARTVDIEDRMGLLLEQSFDVRGYNPTRTWDNPLCDGTAALNVYGTFRPDSDYFYGCTMQDGSTLDLSGKTRTWSVQSSASVGRKVVDFATSAQVTLKLEGRRVFSRQIVDWTDNCPTNLSSLAFELDPKMRKLGYRIYWNSNGIFLRGGATIFIR